MLTNGVKVGEYRPDRADDAVDIRVKYPEDERRLMALDKLSGNGNGAHHQFC